MSYSLCIFDLDGTLLDTLEDIAFAANETLLQLGLTQHPTQSYKQFLGKGMDNLVRRFLPSDPEDQLVLKASSIFQTVYRANCNKKSRIYDGIVPMLNTLHDHNIQLAVLSNKPHQYTELCIQHYFASIPFRLVFGHRQGKGKKPDPETALEILSILGTDAQKTLFIGDSAEDIQTGKAAGTKTIGVSWGFRSIDELRHNKADLIVSDPQEISRYAICST